MFFFPCAMVRPQGNKYPSCLLQPCGRIAVARVDFFAFRNFSNTCAGGDLSLSVASANAMEGS